MRLVTSLQSIVAAAAVLSFNASAAALLPSPITLGTIDNETALFGNAHSKGSFTDTFTFTINDPGKVAGSFFSFPASLNVGQLSVSLSNGSSNWSDTDVSDGFSFDGLSQGNYSFSVWGRAGFIGGYYSGSLTASTAPAAPVPEPESVAMMLAGLGLIGVLTRRRKISVA